MTNLNSVIQHQRILGLDPNKAIVDNDIPVKILNEGSNVVSKYLSYLYNRSKLFSNYPGPLKLGTVIPINKKSTKNLKYERLSSYNTISYYIQII